MLIYLMSHSFSLNILGNITKGFIKRKDFDKSSGKPGLMGGIGVEMGYRFDFSAKWFAEWNFLSVHGAFHRSYFGNQKAFNWETVHPNEVYSDTRDLKGGIELDVGVTQFQIGKLMTDKFSAYGIINPATVFAGNVAGACSNIPNLGILLGVGARYRFSNLWSGVVEVRYCKSYLAKEFRKDVLLGDFESKFSFFRFLLGMNISRSL